MLGTSSLFHHFPALPTDEVTGLGVLCLHYGDWLQHHVNDRHDIFSGEHQRKVGFNGTSWGSSNPCWLQLNPPKKLQFE